MRLPALVPIPLFLLLLSSLACVRASPVAVSPTSSAAAGAIGRGGPATRPRPTSLGGPSATPLRVPAAELKPRAAAAVAAPEPQQTCENSGVGNTGCNNSGINNTGTGNSGINNCGTGQSGVGAGCDDDGGSNSNTVAFVGVTTTVNGGTVVIAAGATNVGATVYTTTLTGAASTLTLVADGRSRRVDCAYWQAQGYVCSGAVGRRSTRLLVTGLVAVGTGAWLVVG